MATKLNVQKRRKYVKNAVEDGLRLADIASHLGITIVTLRKDWQAVQDWYIQNNMLDERMTAGLTRKLAVCAKLDLLKSLGYSQSDIANLLNISLSSVYRYATWAEENGHYSQSFIRVFVHDGLQAVDGKDVEPGEFLVRPGADENVWIAPVGREGWHIVPQSELATHHTLISAYQHDYEGRK